MAASKKEEKPADGAGDEAKKKKKKMMLFIIVGVVVVLLLLGGTFFLATKLAKSKNADSEDGASSSEASESSEAESGSAKAIYFALKPNFTVNFDVNGRQRFLQTEIAFMYREESVMQTVELHMPAIRNAIVMLLSSQDFAALQTLEGKEKLRADALEAVQEIIAKESAAAAEKDKEKNKDKKVKKSNANIEQILFTQFVMQ